VLQDIELHQQPYAANLIDRPDDEDGELFSLNQYLIIRSMLLFKVRCRKDKLRWADLNAWYTTGSGQRAAVRLNIGACMFETVAERLVWWTRVSSSPDSLTLWQGEAP
jgi:hypothetical protein